MAKEPKKGIRTTEFWVTLASIGLAALVSLGVLTPHAADVIRTQAGVIGDAIVRLAGAVGAIVAAVKYARFRTELKK